ncbi:GGDEF domain-containing protein [Psychrobium sp. 1_MG-2023]|uniref:GGDEF domain-containing protein n=1 Tax=Psychrobium sp. 1_MG-2023 TaxID=3062624 RepID=UPI000C32A134|nr:GGDEF domain-containing protein [Psychrobium sp. 1_MG-2023]MDP2562226.1 GGDEF domain-containing protein [Psychrobium sp. 1_MG-2023]PKF57480.1 hypothetical protein CW748_06190 [Alteromonadales bacterium alter-6D02]
MDNQIQLRLIERLNERLMSYLSVIWACFTCVILSLFLLRSVEVGWGYDEFIYLFLIVLLGVFLSVRSRLSNHFTVHLLFTLNLIAGIWGVLNYGTQAVAVFYLLLSVIIAALFYKKRVIIAAAVGVVLIFIFAGIKFTTVPQADGLNEVNTHWHWIIYTSGVIFFILMATSTLYIFRQEMESVLGRLNEQYDKLSQVAGYDELTGLATFRLMRKQWQQACLRAQRHQRKAAIMFVDLDNFKSVNDYFGHDAGDHCLRVIAKRTTGLLRGNDMVARIGGDEFLVILEDIDHIEDVKELSTKLIDKLSQSISFNDHHFSVGCSIGIALYPEHGVDVDTLRNLADKAMYCAKDNGKNQFAIFST